MKYGSRLSVALVSLVVGGILVATGCNQSGTGGQAGATDAGKPVADKGDKKHDEWWCAEHGIPEEICSMCSEKVAKEFKAKGDWCEKHDRAKSQCFICDPSLKEKYAAMYRAKYDGKEPPPIEEEKEEKK